MHTEELHTPRLLLRHWRDADLPALAAINADPEVMAHFPACLTRAQSDDLCERIRAHLAAEGFGVWAVQRRDCGAVIGLAGLQRVAAALPCAPAVEIAWRLARAHWGQGFAREAAAAALQHGFQQLHLEQIVAFTTLNNLRSQQLMQRLGMQHQPEEEFLHPLLPADSPLRAHVLYRLRRLDWLAGQP